MTLHSAYFIRHSDLTAFVNANNIAKANVLKIENDTADGGYTLFWWA